MDKIETIKTMYDRLDFKMDFLLLLSQKVDASFWTIKNHHFGGKWKIPEKYQDLYITELTKVLERQKSMI